MVSTVGQSGTSIPALWRSHQRRWFYWAGYYYVFYPDGVDLVYRSSPDGVNWSASHVLWAGWGFVPGIESGFDVYAQNGEVWIAASYGPGPVNQPLYYRTGTASGGVLTLTDWAVAYGPGLPVNYKIFRPSICPNFVAFARYTYGVSEYHRAMVARIGAAWDKALMFQGWGFGDTQDWHTDVLPMGENVVYAVGNSGGVHEGPSLIGRLCTWNPVTQTWTSDSLESIGTTGRSDWSLARDSSLNIQAVYSTGKYRKRTAGVWGAETVVDSGLSNLTLKGDVPSIVFASGGDIWFRTLLNGGWSERQYIAHSEIAVNSVHAEEYHNAIGAAWTNAVWDPGHGIYITPFDVRFGLLDVPIIVSINKHYDLAKAQL